MNPNPPSANEGSSLPPRHRPNLTTFVHDTTELDLWDFDEESVGKAGTESAEGVRPARTSDSAIPTPRERIPTKPRSKGDIVAPRLPTGGSAPIRIHISRELSQSKPQIPAKESHFNGELHDIEDWDLPTEVPQSEASPSVAPPVAPDPVIPPVSLAAEPPEQTGIPEDRRPQVEGTNEFSPVLSAQAAPISLRPHWGLSSVERAGLLLLLLLLVVGMGTVFFVSLRHLPMQEKRAKAADFPIKGAHVTIDKAESYWREPLTEGDKPDTFRRGTQLLPVLEVVAHGPSAAMRVYFRNEDHAVIGDAVTRTVREGTVMQIPATAGFDDLGMHAAYRTGEGKPWTIEVLEAPSESAPGSEFKKLFEINISTDRR